MNIFEATVGGGHLRVVQAEHVGPVAHDPAADARFVTLARPDEIHDDPILHYLFTQTYGDHGYLTSIREDLPAQAMDLASPADTAARWLRDRHLVIVTCVGSVPLDVTAGVLLVAAGVPISSAMALVRDALPDGLPSPDEEISVSVARDHLVEIRALRRRREEAVARGESPWSVR